MEEIEKNMAKANAAIFDIVTYRQEASNVNHSFGFCFLLL